MSLNYKMFLRQAPRAFLYLLRLLKEYEGNGCYLSSCDIVYKKRKYNSRRRVDDIGVYEELVHVFDLLFGVFFPGKSSTCVVKAVRFTNDQKYCGKYIASDIFLEIPGEKETLSYFSHNSRVTIFGSFVNKLHKNEQT